LGSGNFARAPICGDTQKILFCADNNGKNSASEKKLAHAAEQLALKGVSVWQAIPTQEKQDFNDVLKTQGVEAIRERLDSAMLLQDTKTVDIVQEKIQTFLKGTRQPKNLSPDNSNEVIQYSTSVSDRQIMPETGKDFMTHLKAIREKKAFNDTVEKLSQQYGKKQVEAVIGESGIYRQKVEICKSSYAVLEQHKTICLVPYKSEMEKLKGGMVEITEIMQPKEYQQIKQEITRSGKDIDRDL